MVADMPYTTVSDVVESWEMLRRMDNFQEVSGVMLFKIFFEMEPDAVQVFSFGKHTELNDEFFKSPMLRRHAIHYMNMVDRAIALLGPDIELLTDIMLELGEKHVKYGVHPKYYSPMGKAMFITLQTLLKDEFTPEIKESWLECYQAFSYDMIRARTDRAF